MKEQKLTPWFPASVKPVRDGVYQTRPVRNTDGPEYQHWNGVFWGRVCSTSNSAYLDRNYRSIFQNDQWRGLAKEPK